MGHSAHPETFTLRCTASQRDGMLASGGERKDLWMVCLCMQGAMLNWRLYTVEVFRILRRYLSTVNDAWCCLSNLMCDRNDPPVRASATWSVWSRGPINSSRDSRASAGQNNSEAERRRNDEPLLGYNSRASPKPNGRTSERNADPFSPTLPRTCRLVATLRLIYKSVFSLVNSRCCGSTHEIHDRLELWQKFFLGRRYL